MPGPQPRGGRKAWENGRREPQGRVADPVLRDLFDPHTITASSPREHFQHGSAGNQNLPHDCSPSAATVTSTTIHLYNTVSLHFNNECTNQYLIIGQTMTPKYFPSRTQSGTYFKILHFTTCRNRSIIFHLPEHPLSFYVIYKSELQGRRILLSSVIEITTLIEKIEN